MSLFGAVWLTNLNSNQPVLPISEKNSCFDLQFMWMKERGVFLDILLSPALKKVQNGNLVQFGHIQFF
jgi:hypothetical protein